MPPARRIGWAPAGEHLDRLRPGRHPCDMFGLGFTEILVIVLIVALLFGARRLPELGSGLGKAIKNFKAGVSNDEIDVTPEKDKVEGEGKGSEAGASPPPTGSR